MRSRTSPEQHFSAYRRTGDPRALARVFDGTAGELYGLAGHLGGSQQAAEDLVQETFLRAMERASTWDEQRPLMPWLLGILANVARAGRARELRQRKLPDDTLSKDVAPLQSAIESELGETLGRALRDLEEPYRRVLMLTLEHGLQPKEIAELDGQPASTVRTWIARGLEQLRRRLPAGIAAAPGVFALDPSRLAAVREQVLARILPTTPAAASVGLAATLLGSFAVNKTLITLGAVAVTSLGAFLLLRDPAPESLPLDPMRAPTEAQAQTARVRDAKTSDSTATPIGTEPSKARSASAGVAPSLELTVRRSSGLPAVGLPVLCGEQQARTDPEGKITLLDLQPGSITLDVLAGLVTETLELTMGTRSAVSLELPPLVSVQGQVTDRLGEPVGGAELHRWGPGRIEVSANDGSYVVPWMPADKWLTARASGHESSPGLYVQGADGAEITHDFQLRRPALPFAGLVLTPSGVPAVGAEIELIFDVEQGASMGRTRVSLETDGAGRFTSDEVPAGRHHFSVQHEPSASARLLEIDHDPDQDPLVTVQLLETARLEVHMTRGDGEPVEGGFVQLFAGSEMPAARFIDQFGKTDAEGTFVWDRVVPITAQLYAGFGAQSRSREAVFEPGQTLRWEVELPAAGSLPIRVVDGAGEPRVGWVLEVTPRTNISTRHVGVTDAEGRFLCEGLGTEWNYNVSVFEPEEGEDPHKDFFSRLPVGRVEDQPLGREVLVTVGEEDLPGVFLRGQVVDEEGRPIPGPMIELYRPDVSSYRRHRRSHGGPDGTFAIGPLPPGAYSLRSLVSGWTIAECALQEFDVGDHDLGQLVCHRAARVVIRCDEVPGDEPVNGPFVALQAEDGTLRSLDQRGWIWSSDMVRPGAYTLFFSHHSTHPIRRRLELRAGVEEEIAIELQPATEVTYRVRFPDSWDDIFPAGWLRVWDAGGNLLVQEQLGRLFREPRTVIMRRALLPGSYRVEAEAPGLLADGQIQVADEACVLEMTMR